jgi:hypothetical protein
VQVAEGSGCGQGEIPSDGSAFTVDATSQWTLYFAYTCDGTFHGIGDPAVVFTAHNAATGADLAPVVQPGPWGYGGSGLTGTLGASPPAGKYILRVRVADSNAHTCQWHAAIRRR